MKFTFYSFIALIVLMTGCASFSPSFTPRRELVLENNYTRETTVDDILQYRRPHRMKPILFADKIIASNSHDGVVSYNKKSGVLQWRKNIPNGSEAGAILYKEKLYVGGNDGQFYCLNAHTGKTLWSFNAKAEILSNALAEDGKIYFLSGANVLYSLDADTGRQLWLYNRLDTANITVRGGATPVLKNGRLYVGFSDGFFLALHEKDGSVIWERQLGSNPKFNDVDATAVLDEKNIYVSSFDGAFYALSQEDGQIIWRVEEGGYAPALMVNSTLIYPTTSRKLMAISKTDGAILWSKEVKRGVATTPVQDEDKIIYGESIGNLKVASLKTGELLGQFSPGRGVFTEPAFDIKESKIYFISNEGNLYSLNMKWQDPRLRFNWERN